MTAGQEVQQLMKISAGKYFFGDPEDVLSTKDWKYVQSQSAGAGTPAGKCNEFLVREKPVIILISRSQEQKSDDDDGEDEEDKEDENVPQYLGVIPFDLCAKSKKPSRENIMDLSETTPLQLFRLVDKEDQSEIFHVVIQHKKKKWEAWLYSDDTLELLSTKVK